MHQPFGLMKQGVHGPGLVQSAGETETSLGATGARGVLHRLRTPC